MHYGLFYEEENIDGNRDMTFKKENGNREIIEEDAVVIWLKIIKASLL